jgi:hypothetical protein
MTEKEAKMSQVEEARQDEEIKAPDAWYGVRHTQVLLCFLLLSIAYSMRVNLSVAIVAMTDKTTSPNPDIPVSFPYLTLQYHNKR